MPNYIITNYVNTGKTVQEALADLETKLETLDSTTNPIRLIKVVRTPNNEYKAVLLYTDTS